MSTKRRHARLKQLIAIAILACSGTAFAQSPGDLAPPPSGVIPLPDPLPKGINPDDPLAINPQPDLNNDPSRSQTGYGDDDSDIEILYDTEILPVPVKRMRELIMEAARSGDLEELRVLMGTGANITQLAFGDIEGDPIEYLRSGAGDEEGHEMLAILLEVMEAGYVRFDAGTSNELYVWPYFYAVALETLTPKQRVELFKLVTAGDYEDMLSFGAYIFFRVGITPEGRWLFFVAGD
ncbi:MAG: hypothetical protein AAGF25_03395 [Pseudomonadota bacterium]